MPSVYPPIVMHVSMCITAQLDRISIQVISSGTDFGGLVYVFIGLKVVVCLPSKDMVETMSLHVCF
jgi:hypothetical protein